MFGSSMMRIFDYHFVQLKINRVTPPSHLRILRITMEVLQPDDALLTFRMSHLKLHNFCPVAESVLLLLLTVSAWMIEMKAVWECPSSTWLVTCRM